MINKLFEMIEGIEMDRVGEMVSGSGIYDSDLNSKSSSSLVENTLISDCSLKASSSDQIGVLFNDSDRAKYGSSFVSLSCGESLLAVDKNLEYLSSWNDFIYLFNKDKLNENEVLSILEYFIISFLLSDSSNLTKYGTYNLHSLSDNFSIICLLAESDLKNENKILASGINSFGSFDILDNNYLVTDNLIDGQGSDNDYNPCLFATLRFNSSPSLMQSSSVNLLSFNNSSAIKNSIDRTNFLVTLVKADSNLSSSPLGMFNLISISFMKGDNDVYYLSFSTGHAFELFWGVELLIGDLKGIKAELNKSNRENE